MKKTLIRGGEIVTSDGQKKSDVLVSVTGEIEAVKPSIHEKDTEIIEAEGMLLFPLLIDCHVHFREPGLEHKATMETEAASALAGGIGAMCEMPNTIPPTVSVAALADKVRRASHIDHSALSFFFGVTEAAHLRTLKDLWTGDAMELRKLRHHCAGVKIYLDHSTGDQKVDGGIIEEIFSACAELKIPLVAHCEDPSINNAAKTAVEMQAAMIETTTAIVETRDSRVSTMNESRISLHSDMRPPESEEQSIRDAIKIVKKTGAALHIAHLSTSNGTQLVRQAKKDGLPVTCEVAPHHLFLTIDDYDSLGTLCKMNPPVRTRDHRDALWLGIADGTVDCIATDHAPHTLEEKNVSPPLSAPSGVPGVETMLPLLLSVAAGAWPHPSSRQPSTVNCQLSYPDILRLCFTNPKRIFSLHAPAIEPKHPARIGMIDPHAEWTIKGTNLKSKCGWTPYENWSVHGKVVRTVCH